MVTSTRTPGQIKSIQKATKARKQSGNRKASAATGYVEAGESFSMEGFIERLGTTRSGVSEMRRRGLVVRKDGGRVRVLGADYLKYLASLPVAGLDEDS
ncbi:hypothetical protein [Schlesneria sp. T3-172]|uniref:hypothetical protein n=1 Tax=Schlesneria sphaerica TaxID=3373610 RepID=UPI0037C79C08